MGSSRTAAIKHSSHRGAVARQTASGSALPETRRDCRFRFGAVVASWLLKRSHHGWTRFFLRKLGLCPWVCCGAGSEIDGCSKLSLRASFFFLIGANSVTTAARNVPRSPACIPATDQAKRDAEPQQLARSFRPVIFPGHQGFAEVFQNLRGLSSSGQ